MLSWIFITAAQIEWHSSKVFVLEKDDSLNVYVDDRKLNKVAKQDLYPVRAWVSIFAFFGELEGFAHWIITVVIDKLGSKKPSFVALRSRATMDYINLHTFFLD